MSNFVNFFVSYVTKLQENSWLDLMVKLI
jgi:hypothetical protein